MLFSFERRLEAGNFELHSTSVSIPYPYPFVISSALSEEPNYLHTQAIYSLSGKCFTTQGVMQHRVIFPSKPNGLTVLLHAPKDIADKMDPEVANW